jgi:hypothetical protein
LRVTRLENGVELLQQTSAHLLLLTFCLKALLFRGLCGLKRLLTGGFRLLLLLQGRLASRLGFGAGAGSFLSLPLLLGSTLASFFFGASRCLRLLLGGGTTSGFVFSPLASLILALLCG